MYIFTSLLHQLYCSVKLCGRDHTKPFLKGLCQLLIYVIYVGPYWEKLCPLSWIPPEVNSTWLITSELANQHARKTLFTCVVYTNNAYSTPEVMLITSPQYTFLRKVWGQGRGICSLILGVKGLIK